MITADTIADDDLPADTAEAIEAAFADGRLYIEIDAEKQLHPHLSFVDRPAKWNGIGALVHVISRPAHGEIRGYVLIDGRLHLRLPNYAGDWPALDAAVARRISNRVNHTTQIETEMRGVQVGNGEHHLYHRWTCACGAAGSWGHALWSSVSLRSAEQSALAHVTNARAKESL